MTHDATLPPGHEPTRTTAELQGVCYAAARWTPQDFEALGRSLRSRGRKALGAVTARSLLDAWCQTVEAFRDPESADRQAIDPSLVRLCRLSQPGLDAALEAVLGGVSRPAAERLQRQAEQWLTSHAERPLVLVALAANLPALAVQPLLPALLLRLPVILKSPSAEPLFAPAFMRALTRRLPELRDGVAAITWRGGDRSLEAPLLALADRILAYGEAETLADLSARAPGKLFAYGPRTSLAIIDRSVAPTKVAAGLARDIALFDQRGCLSVQAIFTDGDAPALARQLAVELGRLADRWPAGPLDPLAAAGVQQIRSEARLRGLHLSESPLAVGTVVVDSEARFQPSPGLRTVRIHPVEDLAALEEILIEWTGRLQGAALSGAAAWRLRDALEALGMTWFAEPGELQTPDALWHNGGVHPFCALTGNGNGAD